MLEIRLLRYAISFFSNGKCDMEIKRLRNIDITYWSMPFNGCSLILFQNNICGQINRQIMMEQIFEDASLNF